MPTALLALLAALGVFLMLNGRRQAARHADPDAETLSALVRAGSDLGRPHDIEFFLYFPSREAADQAAGQLRDEGFATAVSSSDAGDDWLCLATRTMRPTLDELQRLRRHLAAVAESRDGAYDGWGTTVTSLDGEG